jgi:Apea-like HEPN
VFCSSFLARIVKCFDKRFGCARKQSTNEAIMGPQASKKKDPELRAATRAFIQAFNDAVASSNEEASRIFKGRGWLGFEGGIVEFTTDLTNALAKLVARAARLLGPKGGNENAIRELALKEAQKSFVENVESDAACARLIDLIFEEGNAQFEFLVPNYLFVFEGKVRSIEIGPVRAALTSDLATELHGRSPNNRINVTPGAGFSLQYVGSPPVAHIEMHPRAWLVSVGATKDNVEEEAKWLIDVAVSFLRLHYKSEGARFPRYGDVEPHPMRPKNVDNVGVKLGPSATFVGGASVPHAYEITAEVQAITAVPEFQSKAKRIFNPPDKSVAARISQGLGWLTRGRQAEDRAERLLYFFTAIESLLSNDDKAAPIVQTVARHAAVLLTDNVKDRVGLSTEIKKLYTLRSALVHSGNRGVLWNAANMTQHLAEAMFTRVLDVANLSASHTKFCDELATASFGLPWPISGD